MSLQLKSSQKEFETLKFNCKIYILDLAKKTICDIIWPYNEILRNKNLKLVTYNLKFLALNSKLRFWKLRLIAMWVYN